MFSVNFEPISGTCKLWRFSFEWRFGIGLELWSVEVLSTSMLVPTKTKINNNFEIFHFLRLAAVRNTELLASVSYVTEKTSKYFTLRTTFLKISGDVEGFFLLLQRKLFMLQ